MKLFRELWSVLRQQSSPGDRTIEATGGSPVLFDRELVEHIRRLCPSTRVLCTSGYIWHANHEHDTAYLQKPFTSQELRLKVNGGEEP